MTTKVDKQLELELMHKTAAERGGKCLSTVYINAHTKYLWEDSDGNQWLAPWYRVKQGNWSKSQGYKKNAKSLIKYVIQDLYIHAESKGGLCLSTVYVNTKTKYQFQDKSGHIFWMTWDNCLAGQWSPEEKKITLSKLKTKYTIPYMDIFALSKKCTYVSHIIKNGKKELTLIDKDGIIFTRNTDNMINQDYCVARKTSRGEYEIQQFLTEHGVTFKDHDRLSLGENLEIDAFVASRRFGIEYHGVGWHTEDKIGKNKHRRKYELAKQNGIDLIQVFDHEWRDRNLQVKSFIKSKLKLNSRKIGARSTELKIVPKNEAIKFLEDYHIQGSGNFEEAIGLYKDSELLMLIAIGNHHRGLNDKVLTRCVSKDGVTVSGGLSKLCKFAKEKHGELTTWIDLRWSTGDSWIRLGWKLEKELSPDYFYYHTNKKRIVKKQARMKSIVNTPAGMTEKEHAYADGLERVWDCGKLKLTLK